MVNSSSKTTAVALAVWLGATAFSFGADGDAIIRARAGDSEIVIITTSRLAGAIHSLTWNGQEFINSTDHGRQLQSACSFDNSQRANAETFNPTEAGSRNDSFGTNSTSRLLAISADGNHLRTQTRMAFWLLPGERSEKQLARNTNALSDYTLTKDVTIGFERWPQALDYRVTFSVPTNTHHVSAQFEVLTGYLPDCFNSFYQFDPQEKKFKQLSRGPGEIKNPVVLATADGKFAMGVFSITPKESNMRGPNYGRWFFDWAHVSKWNCVYRVSKPDGIRHGDYNYRLLVPVGTLAQVESMMTEWSEMKW